MTFWLLAIAMMALALLFVLPPLWRRNDVAVPAARRRQLQALDQAHAAGVLDEAEYRRKREALDSTPAPAVRSRPVVVGALLLLAIPAAAVLLYLSVGEPAGLDPQARIAGPAAVDAHADGVAPDMDQAVAGLAERLRNEPDNLEGWLLLGRAYKTMERFEPAREALAHAYRLAPGDPDVMVEYAEAQALAAPARRFDGDSLALLQRAVEAAPQHQRGIWLLGIAAMQAGDPAAAIAHWQALQGMLGDDAEARDSLQQQIDAARAQLDGAPLAAMPAATPPTAAASATSAAEVVPPAPAASAVAAIDHSEAAAATNGSGPRLTLQVALAPELAARVSASDVLFVYARATEGPRVPLAIQRLPAGRLPLTVVLDDSTSMLPELTLSSLDEVLVGARISRGGLATPQAGDLETAAVAVATRRREPLSLTIDRVVE
jgi:cytochrome c-type biogenesis protein CcmH